MIRCTVGVMAYNEEDSIVPVLQALLAQRAGRYSIDEIIVVASGCTDRTIERASAMASRYPLIRVDVEPIRSGKAAAVNRLLGLARGAVVVLVGADTLPDPTALERLIAPFADPTVGMTGARVVPLNSAHSLLGWTVHLLWHLHHRLATQNPKLGELVAFRNVIATIPPETATDEVALEAALTARGLRLVYVPEAIVYNYGPATLGDFLAQRRRIYAGHLHIAAALGYRPVSMNNRWLARLALGMMLRHPLLIVRLLFAMVIETYARLLGLIDHHTRHDHRAWRQVRSTKQVQREGQQRSIVVINCRDALDTGELLRCAAQIPPELGSLLWWDSPLCEAIFALPAINRGAVEQNLAALVNYFGPPSRLMVAYRLVEFTTWQASDYMAAREEREEVGLCAALH